MEFQKQISGIFKILSDAKISKISILVFACNKSIRFDFILGKTEEDYLNVRVVIHKLEEIREEVVTTLHES